MSFAFVPSRQQTENSNIFRFMCKHSIKSLDELQKKSVSELDWYWNAVNDDLGIVWDKKYTIVSDFSSGIQWPKWFVDGKLNIANTISETAKKFPEKIGIGIDECTALIIQGNDIKVIGKGSVYICSKNTIQQKSNNDTINLK